MTAKSQILAVTPRYRWRIRNQEADSESTQDCAADLFFLKRQRKLFGDKTPDPNQNLLQLLPEPQSFKDIAKATDRILRAMDCGEPITIFGDYDVDGTTSCAMLRRFFQEIGYPVDVYIPERLIEGYGLNPLGLRKIKDLGCKLVITVDNGISAVDACATANELGMDVIITDHHDLPPELPAAFAILNPKQRDCQFPFKMLAGVGVAFYLMVSLRAALKERNASRYGNINLRSYLDFVALGTIADLAPLDGVNHILCKTGLEVMLQEIRKGKRHGIAALLELTGWKSETGLIEAADVGFKLGPCLNAAGRLGTALASEEILSTEDPTRARELALFLSGENAERQRIERAIKEEAFAQIQELGSIPPALILHAEHWHPGVVGIVASRVLEKYYRPTLILGTLDGKIKGSGRSTHAFDLFAALNEVRDEFHAFGGHFHAIGLTVAADKFEWLRNYLISQATARILNEDTVQPLDIDGFLDLSAIDEIFLQRLAAFEPFGIENPRPKWMIAGAKVKLVKRIGKDLSHNHARILVGDGSGEMWLTAFQLAPQMESAFSSGMNINLVVEGKLSFYRGIKKAEFKIIDFTVGDLDGALTKKSLS
jgi:single-stranded-DNA-specific exonuclease